MKQFKALTIMGRNGWEFISPGEKKSILDEGIQFKSTFLGKTYKSTIIAIVAQYKKDLDICGSYGVLWLEAAYEYKQPAYTWHDLEDMKECIIAAEENLLCIGMPFQKDYIFHGENVEEKMKVNKTLRELYNLEELEGAAE